jgi:acetyltransferase-like isoleucine patch superfamily enzyme
MALVETDAIGPGARIWAFAHVLAGARVGSNCNVGDHVFIEGGAIVGNNVTVKNNVCIWDGVVIEDDVFVGPNVTFTNDRTPRSPRMAQVAGRYAHKENWLCRTTVRRGSTIGAGATLLPGIELGPYCFIAAGAVVTRNVPPFALMVGSPARRHGDVCRCGHKLADRFDVSCCPHCDETPLDRINGLHEQHNHYSTH